MTETYALIGIGVFSVVAVAAIAAILGTTLVITDPLHIFPWS